MYQPYYKNLSFRVQENYLKCGINVGARNQVLTYKRRALGENSQRWGKCNTEGLALYLILFRMLIKIIMPLAKTRTLRKIWFHRVEEDDGDNEDEDCTSDSTPEPYPPFQSFDLRISKQSMVNTWYIFFLSTLTFYSFLWVFWIFPWNRYIATL